MDDAANNAAVINARNAARLVRQKRLNALKLAL